MTPDLSPPRRSSATADVWTPADRLRVCFRSPSVASVPFRWLFIFALFVSVLAAAGCRGDDRAYVEVPNYGIDDGSVEFVDGASSRGELADVPIRELPFVDQSGRTVTLDELAPGKPVVLVITRGRTKPICPICTTQTARLIAAYSRFSELGAEVVVVYPRPEDVGGESFDSFLEVVSQRLDRKEIEVPFPIVFDVGLQVVRRLGVAGSLAKPTTMVLDEKRSVRFAFVGETFTHRPSIESLLDEVRKLSPPEGD